MTLWHQVVKQQHLASIILKTHSFLYINTQALWLHLLPLAPACGGEPPLSDASVPFTTAVIKSLTKCEFSGPSCGTCSFVGPLVLHYIIILYTCPLSLFIPLSSICQGNSGTSTSLGVITFSRFYKCHPSSSFA